MTVLILADHTHASLLPATLHAVGAAAKLGGDIHLLVAGAGCEGAAQQAAAVAGVTKVLLADDAAYAHGSAENIAPLVVRLAPAYSHILASSTSSGKNILPRAAALLDVQMVSDVVAISAPNTFVRPIYAGNAMATVQSADAIKVLTIRTTGFDKAPAQGGQAAIEAVAGSGDTGLATFIGQEIAKLERPELTAARVVVAGGRGVGSADNFKIIEALADKLQGAVGASRAAVDAGYIANDAQVGQTGKVVAPELYIAAGISGAIQHLAGMKDSKVIVAINKDPEAPIFQIADYGLVADLFVAVPEMTGKL